MDSDSNVVDITGMPELERLAEEVNETGRPRRLCRAGREIAVLVPPSPRGRRSAARTPTQADIDAFLSSAGAWKDVDTDKLLADIYESRRSSRPRVDL